MPGAQTGYAKDAAGRPIEGWPPGWVVIGSDDEGTFVAESATVDARVVHAQRRMGGWVSSRVDASVTNFADRLKVLDRFAKAVWGRRRPLDADALEAAVRELASELRRVGKMARGGYWDELVGDLAEEASDLAPLRPAPDVAPVHRFVQHRLSPALRELGGFDDVIAGAHAETRGLLVAGIVRSQQKVDELRRVVDGSGLTDVVWRVQVRPELRA